MTRYRYEIVPRRPELGGGVRLRLLEDGAEVGGGVFPASDSEAAHDIAWCDAECEGEAWLDSRPQDVSSAHMLTCSGIDYVPGALRVRDVRIADIAHALSLICRFGGHCAGHYSVAAHSLLVVRILEAMEAPPAALLCGLLHDAHEAYVGDVPTPIKAMLGTAWIDLEHQAEEVVLDAFGLRSSTGLSHSRSGKLWNVLIHVTGRRLSCGGLCCSRRLVLLKAACDARSSMTT